MKVVLVTFLSSRERKGGFTRRLRGPGEGFDLVVGRFRFRFGLVVGRFRFRFGLVVGRFRFRFRLAGFNLMSGIGLVTLVELVGEHTGYRLALSL